jgi:outer membrane immunogenic protein
MYSKAPIAVTPAFTWTGFYIGAHIGGGVQEGTSTLLGAPAPLFFPLGTEIAGSSGGFIGGGQVGYNYQFNPNWVLGIEGDISGSTIKTTTVTPSTLVPGVIVTGTVKNNWLATLAGRLGYAAGPWLFYAKGGAAWTNVTYGGGAAGAIVNESDVTHGGWTVGLGVENSFAKNWSWKLEYNYMDFGSKAVGLTTTPFFGTTVNSVDLQYHVGKVGVNYRFY